MLDMKIASTWLMNILHSNGFNRWTSQLIVGDLKENIFQRCFIHRDVRDEITVSAAYPGDFLKHQRPFHRLLFDDEC